MNAFLKLVDLIAYRVLIIYFSAKKIIHATLQKFIQKLNRYLLKKSFAAAEKKAKKIKEETGKKVWVFLWNGDFEAMTKQDFKIMWQCVGGLKKRSIEAWQKLVYEY
jgi:hypothetical protein